MFFFDHVRTNASKCALELDPIVLQELDFAGIKIQKISTILSDGELRRQILLLGLQFLDGYFKEGVKFFIGHGGG